MTAAGECDINCRNSKSRKRESGEEKAKIVAAARTATRIEGERGGERK